MKGIVLHAGSEKVHAEFGSSGKRATREGLCGAEILDISGCARHRRAHVASMSLHACHL